MKTILMMTAALCLIALGFIAIDSAFAVHIVPTL